MRTRNELKQLAKDIHAGSVFTDRNVRPGDQERMLSMIFMPLIFLDEETIEKWKEDPPGMFYEYIEKAMPTGVNGYPMFMSMSYLTKKEAEIVVEYYEKVDEALKNI